MDDQFPPINWTTRPGALPSWMPAAMLGGMLAPWRAPTPSDWSQSTPTDASSDRPSGRGILGQFDLPPGSDRPTGRGILGQFDLPPENAWAQTTGGAAQSPSLSAPLSPPAAATAPPYGGWYRNSPSWVHSAMPLGANVGFSAAPAEPAYHPWTDPRDGKNGANAWERPSPIPPSPAPVLPLHGPYGWYYPGAQLDPTPPAPPKDFRTRLHETLSDENVRYYAGPHFFEALQKLTAVTQLLPGSGTVQATQDASQAREDAQAGNYGKAAAHLGMGTANAALDWLPAGKLGTALLAGMGARTFPWARLPPAERMEKAGRSIDEIWRETGFWRGPDDHWRFEISDRGYRVNPKAGILDSEGYRAAPLYEHQNHPGMREAYPWLAEAQSRLRIDPDVRTYAAFVPGTGIDIEVPTKSMLRSLSMHELQHMIAHVEGFARGGAPLEFMGPGVSYQQAHALYERLAGEVEARNAQYRMYNLNDAARLRRSPQSTEEIPRHHQIIRFYPADR